MYTVSSIRLLRAAFLNVFKRNLCRTNNGWARSRIHDNIVFINDGENKQDLQIRFNWSGNKTKAILFVRPINDPINESLKSMTRKLQNKAAKFTDNVKKFNLKLIDTVNGEQSIERTWQEIIPILSTYRLQLGNDQYDIVYNYPLIHRIELPEKTSVGFDLYPSLLEYTGDLSALSFKWFVRKHKNSKWIEIDNIDGCVYHCGHDDLGAKVKVVGKTEHNDIHTSTYTSNLSQIDQAMVDLAAIEARHKYTMDYLPMHQFRVISYNLLADFYARSEYSKNEIFNYCKSEYLDHEYRNKVQLKELKGYNGDLYCLQELDESTFEHNFSLFFGLLGLNGIFRKKSGTDEGLAIFYNSKKFSLLADHTLMLSEALQTESYLLDLCSIINKNPELKEKVLELFNVAVILHLRSKTNENKELIVVNTHLYSQPNCHSVRLIQLACILRHIENVIKKNGNNISVVICGDLNSLPENVLNSFMLNGNASTPYEEYENDIFKVADLNISHPFNLKSAYENVKFTNYSINFDWKTLDYIYNTKDLKLIQTVPMPDDKTLMNKIPSEQFPSDHLALIADFEWNTNKQNKLSNLIKKIMFNFTINK